MLNCIFRGGSIYVHYLLVHTSQVLAQSKYGPRRCPHSLPYLFCGVHCLVGSRSVLSTCYLSTCSEYVKVPRYLGSVLVGVWLIGGGGKMVRRLFR